LGLLLPIKTSLYVLCYLFWILESISKRDIYGNM